MTDLDGRRLVAQGREAELYEWGEGRILRLQRHSDGRIAMDRSTRAIAVAHAAGVPTPAVLETVELAGRPGQVMERVEGPDQLTALAARPWRVVSVAATLGRLQADLHRVPAPPDLPTVVDAIRDRIAHSSLVPADVAERTAARLDELPGGPVALCHGDLHPANVLESATGPVLIDWTNAARGDPMADVARTRLLLAAASVPDDSPVAVRVLAARLRRVFLRSYLRSYRRRGDLRPGRVERWWPIRAAERLAEGIEEERNLLLAWCREDRRPGGAP